jgi:hypothetical protein
VVGLYKLNAVDPWLERRLVSTIHLRSGKNRFQSLLSNATCTATLWVLNALVNLNGWVWSAVFHARDTPWRGCTSSRIQLTHSLKAPGFNH